MSRANLRTLQPLLGALWVIFFTAGMSQAQTITGVNPNSSNPGVTVNLTITGSNTNFNSATGALLRQGGSVIFSSAYTANSNTNFSATFTLPPNAQGQYDVNVGGLSASPTLINGFSIVGPPLGNYGFISGKLVMDVNQNCIQDGSDTPITNKVVEILPGPFYASTDAQGNYGIWVPLGAYTVQTNIASNLAFQCPAAGSYSVNLTVPGGSVNNQDFYIYEPPPPPVSDLRVTAYTLPHRPGFRAYTVFQVRNVGNQVMNGYTLTGNVSSSMFHLSETPAANSVTTTGNVTSKVWTIPTVNPGQTINFTSLDSLPASIPLGTSLNHSAVITPFDDDSTNNFWDGTRIVTGSYDPNDKQVWTDPGGDNADGFIDPSDNLLRYLIRFQNTGTDTAFNIYIRDTMSANLDLSTLTITDASHNYNMTVNGPGYVEFSFPNILLVDSFTNEPGSNGYIEYTVERVAGLSVGDQIDNTAHIYFDFNAPIVTNTVSSVICPAIAAGFSSTFNNGSFDFSDQSTGTIDTYLWDFGDGNTSSMPSPTHTYGLQGVYTVCLTTTNTCGRTDSTCMSVDFTTSLQDPAVNYFAVYPNPTNGDFVVDLDLKTGVDLGYALYDAVGRLVSEGEAGKVSGVFRQSFDLSSHADGVYFLKLKVNGRTLTRKILKE